MTRPELSTLTANAIADKMRFGPIERAYLQEGLAQMSKARLQVLAGAVEREPVRCMCPGCRLARFFGVK